jgi:hypothetical protein
LPIANQIPNDSVTPQLFLSLAPDLYVEQYYTPSTDPYPGYIQWVGPSGDSVFTIRGNEPNYANLDAAMEGRAQIMLVELLTPYIITKTLLVDSLNTILDVVNNSLQSLGSAATLGNNSDNNLLALAMQILGPIGSMINDSQSNHVPSSVLNNASISNTISAFTKSIAILQQMKNISSTAFNVPSTLSTLSASSNMPSIDTSMLSSGGLTPTSITSLVAAGLTPTSVQSINNIATNNSSLSSNAINHIASITSIIESSNNIPVAELNEIQILLSEIIQG